MFKGSKDLPAFLEKFWDMEKQDQDALVPQPPEFKANFDIHLGKVGLYIIISHEGL